MRLSVKRKDLLKALQLVQVASSKPILPILSSILLEAIEGKLLLTGTDLDISIRCQIPVEVQEVGSVALPAKKMMDIIRDLPQEDINLEMQDNMKVKIQSGEAVFHLLGLPKSDFPEFPEYPEPISGMDNAFNFSSRLIKEMLRKTIFACAVDDVRVVLNGVYWVIEGTNCKMVATDGHRLTCISKEVSQINSTSPIKAIVPTKALQEINRVIKDDEDIQVIISSDKLVILSEGKIFISNLIGGEYPNYERVIPKDQNYTLKAKTSELLAACRRISLMASEKSHTIKFIICLNKMTITALTPNLGEAKEEIRIEYDNPDVEISLNYQYVMDMLKNIDSQEVSISFKNYDLAVVINPFQEERYIGVIMPMKGV